MSKRSARPVLVAVALAVAGCSSAYSVDPSATSAGGAAANAGASPGQGSGAGGSAAGTGSAGGSSGGGGGQGGSGSGGGAAVPTAILVIDAQATFADTATRRNPASDVTARLAVDKGVLDLAKSTGAPFFITYEAATTADHALAPPLAGALPPGAQAFIKTTFDATRQPQFDAAIHASGAKRFLVVGSETDVCVMQTTLGLRREGFEVVVLTDGLFTEEVNVRPALRRWAQAGVAQATIAEAPALVAGGPSPATSVAAWAPVIVRPLEMGFVLHGIESLGSDPFAAGKIARLKELFKISEWFHIPVFAADPTAATVGMPIELMAILTRPIQALTDRPGSVTQLAFAGSHAGLTAAASAARAGGVDVFLIEDTLVGGTTTDLEPAYVAGAVPSTYKTLYYELTRSVDDAGWPSQQWVQDGINWWFSRTSAPEELPPVPGP